MSVRPKDNIHIAYYTLNVCSRLWEWFGNFLQFDEAMKNYFAHVTINIAILVLFFLLVFLLASTLDWVFIIETLKPTKLTLTVTKFAQPFLCELFLNQREHFNYYTVLWLIWWSQDADFTIQHHKSSRAQEDFVRHMLWRIHLDIIWTR